RRLPGPPGETSREHSTTSSAPGSFRQAAQATGAAIDWRDWDVALFAIGFLLIGASAAMVYRLTRGIPIRDPRRLPTAFRGAFVVICGILIVLGSMLAFQRPNVFPWDISP